MSKIIGNFLPTKKTVMHFVLSFKNWLVSTELKFWASIGIGFFLTGLIFLTNSWHSYANIINSMLSKSYKSYGYGPAYFLITGIFLLYLLFLIKITTRILSLRFLFSVVASIAVAFSLRALVSNNKGDIFLWICLCIAISWLSYYVISGLLFTYKWLGKDEDSKNFIQKMTLVWSIIAAIFTLILKLIL